MLLRAPPCRPRSLSVSCPAQTLQQQKVSFQTALCMLPIQPPLSVRLSPSRALCLLTVPRPGPQRPDSSYQGTPLLLPTGRTARWRDLTLPSARVVPTLVSSSSCALGASGDPPLLLTHPVRAEGSPKAREVAVLLCLQLSVALRIRPRLSSVCTTRSRGSGPVLPSPPTADATLPAPPSTLPTTSLLRREAPGLQMRVLLSWLLTTSLSTASRKTSLSQMTLRPPVATSSFTLICFLLITCQNAGEALEGGEPSCTAGGSVDGCSYGGELCGGSLKTWR